MAVSKGFRRHAAMVTFVSFTLFMPRSVLAYHNDNNGRSHWSTEDKSCLKDLDWGPLPSIKSQRFDAFEVNCAFMREEPNISVEIPITSVVNVSSTMPLGRFLAQISHKKKQSKVWGGATSNSYFGTSDDSSGSTYTDNVELQDLDEYLLHMKIVIEVLWLPSGNRVLDTLNKPGLITIRQAADYTQIHRFRDQVMNSLLSTKTDKRVKKSISALFKQFRADVRASKETANEKETASKAAAKATEAMQIENAEQTVNALKFSASGSKSEEEEDILNEEADSLEEHLELEAKTAKEAAYDAAEAAMKETIAELDEVQKGMGLLQDMLLSYREFIVMFVNIHLNGQTAVIFNAKRKVWSSCAYIRIENADPSTARGCCIDVVALGGGKADAPNRDPAKGWEFGARKHILKMNKKQTVKRTAMSDGQLTPSNKQYKNTQDALFVSLVTPNECDKVDLSNSCYATCCDSYFVQSAFCTKNALRCMS